MQVLKEDIRGRILTVARQQFGQNGYSKTSMREIAELAGIGVGNIYNYFTNKDELFREVVRPVVVNVGCGLDTRSQRIGNRKAVFYDMDLPEVITLRRELIPEQPGNVYIAALLLETDWMDDLRRKHLNAQFIFVVEGVLMYFYEKQVKSFLHHVASRFGGGGLWFDVCGTMMSRHGMKPDSLRKHDAQIRSGLSDGHVVEQWEPTLRLIEQANYMKFFRPRWEFFFGQILGRMTRLCYKFSSLLGYKITSK